MVSKKFVIYLSAPSCSGKSALTSVLSDRLPGLYLVASDKLKWQLAGYNRDKHGLLIKKMTSRFFEIVCQMGVPILLDAWINNKQVYSNYLKTAKKYGYEFIPIKLTAPKRVLLQRFRERVIRAKRGGIKISTTDEKTFIKNLSRKSFFPAGTPIFDTSKTTIDSIAAKILKILV